MIHALDELAPEFVGDTHFVAPDAALIGKVRLQPEADPPSGADPADAESASDS